MEELNKMKLKVRKDLKPMLIEIPEEVKGTFIDEVYKMKFEKELLIAKVVLWLGQCVYEQPVTFVEEKFGKHITVDLDNRGLIKYTYLKGVPVDRNDMIHLSSDGWKMYHEILAD